MNPIGYVPALVDQDTFIADSLTILHKDIEEKVSPDEKIPLVQYYIGKGFTDVEGAGRGAMAVEDLKVGEITLEIPESIIISDELVYESNMVCSVVNSAELCRNTHPDREFLEEATKASMRINGYLHICHFAGFLLISVGYVPSRLSLQRNTQTVQQIILHGKTHFFISYFNLMFKYFFFFLEAEF